MSRLLAACARCPLQNRACGSGGFGLCSAQSPSAEGLWRAACVARLKLPASSSPVASPPCFAFLQCPPSEDLCEQTDAALSRTPRSWAGRTRVVPCPQPGARASLNFCLSVLPNPNLAQAAAAPSFCGPWVLFSGGEEEPQPFQTGGVDHLLVSWPSSGCCCLGWQCHAVALACPVPGQGWVRTHWVCLEQPKARSVSRFELLGVVRVVLAQLHFS